MRTSRADNLAARDTRRRRSVCRLACGLAALCAGASVSASPAAAPRPEASLQKTVEELVARLRADARCEVGVHVIRLADGTALADVDADKPLMPASNQKILTSAVALKRLGAKFEFRTVLAVVGDDLVVFGDGDPATGDARLCGQRNETIYAAFDRFAAALKSAEMTRLSGNLVIRAGKFQPPMTHPDWPEDQVRTWYGAPVAGVNLHGNCFDIGFELRDRQLQPVIVPFSRYFQIDNRVRPGKADNWSCRFDAAGRKLSLTGTAIGGGKSPRSVATESPPGMFACVLADRLAQAGIEIKGNLLVSQEAADARGPDRTARVVTAECTPFKDVLARCNKQSLNMMAECLFLRSAVANGQPGTWDKAAELARKVLVNDYGLDDKQFTVADGSGLSKRNRASPACLTALLRGLAGEATFVESLAVAGTDGSLENRLDSPALRGRVLGKTGSLADASALSGYVLDAKGSPVLAFSVLVNGRKYGKKLSAHWLQDSICERLVQTVDAGGSQPKDAGDKRQTSGFRLQTSDHPAMPDK